MDDATSAQLRVINKLAAALDGAGVAWWLFGGWAMDFHAGDVTRPHDDIEVFVQAGDAERARAAVVERGYAVPAVMHPEEGQTFLKDGVEVGAWYLERDTSGAAHVPGRWASWRWPAAWFEAPRRRIGDVEAPVLALDGLLEMKQRFAEQPHGAPLREKDIDDIERLRRMMG